MLYGGYEIPLMVCVALVLLREEIVNRKGDKHGVRTVSTDAALSESTMVNDDTLRVG